MKRCFIVPVAILIVIIMLAGCRTDTPKPLPLSTATPTSHSSDAPSQSVKPKPTSAGDLSDITPIPTIFTPEPYKDALMSVLPACYARIYAGATGMPEYEWSVIAYVATVFGYGNYDVNAPDTHVGVTLPATQVDTLLKACFGKDVNHTTLVAPTNYFKLTESGYTCLLKDYGELPEIKPVSYDKNDDGTYTVVLSEMNGTVVRSNYVFTVEITNSTEYPASITAMKVIGISKGK